MTRHVAGAAFAALLLGTPMDPALGSTADTGFDVRTAMVKDGELLFERGMSADEVAGLRSNVARARANIVAAYGEQRDEGTQIVWCKTRECGTYFGGPTARSYATPGGPNLHGGEHVFDGPAIVLLRQVRARAGGDLLTVETLTHEMSHREFGVRLGRGQVPAWFNEGVATYLGKEHQCAADAKGIDDLYSLRNPAAWRAHTNRGNAVLVGTYCQARNEAAAWIEAKGGFKAVVSMLWKISSGKRFDDLYVPVPGAP